MRWIVVLFAISGLFEQALAKPAFPPRTRDNLPNVQALAAIVVDIKSDEVLYAKKPDEVRPIASTGKLFVALLARERGIDLAAETRITAIDRKLARGGARTRIPVGYSLRNVDLMRAMLVASDNRAPSALGRAIGLDSSQLVRALNGYADGLGFARTHFTDTSGLNGNTSTARELVQAFVIAMADEVIAEILATRRMTIVTTRPRRRALHYANTNKSLRSNRHKNRHRVLGGKTGYTSAAGYCLAIAAQIDGRRVAMVFLGARERLTRYGDFNRVVGWIQDGMPNASSTVDPRQAWRP